MGDLSTEPSMEEILSSIKRIIAEEGDAHPGRSRRPAKQAPAAAPPPTDEGDDMDDEVLELSDPMPAERQPERARPAATARPIERTAEPAREAEPAKAATIRPDPILSDQTAEASRDALKALSRLLVKPEPASDGTLESLVREMLRPMLREWLNTNLPDMVEAMVAREIAKITGAAL